MGKIKLFSLGNLLNSEVPTICHPLFPTCNFKTMVLSHTCIESGFLIDSQQVGFFRTYLLFPNLPAFFIFIDKTGFLIGYVKTRTYLLLCCLHSCPPQTTQQQWRTLKKFTRKSRISQLQRILSCSNRLTCAKYRTQ